MAAVVALARLPPGRRIVLQIAAGNQPAVRPSMSKHSPVLLKHSLVRMKHLPARKKRTVGQIAAGNRIGRQDSLYPCDRSELTTPVAFQIAVGSQTEYLCFQRAVAWLVFWISCIETMHVDDQIHAIPIEWVNMILGKDVRSLTKKSHTRSVDPTTA